MSSAPVLRAAVAPLARLSAVGGRQAAPLISTAAARHFSLRSLPQQQQQQQGQRLNGIDQRRWMSALPEPIVQLEVTTKGVFIDNEFRPSIRFAANGREAGFLIESGLSQLLVIDSNKLWGTFK